MVGMQRRAWRILLALMIVLCALSVLPQADSGESPANASRLSSKGEILSLEKISQKARSYKAGEILEVELEKKHGRYVYEIDILDAGSQVWELKLDAKTGQLLKMEQDD